MKIIKTIDGKGKEGGTHLIHSSLDSYPLQSRVYEQWVEPPAV